MVILRGDNGISAAAVEELHEWSGNPTSIAVGKPISQVMAKGKWVWIKNLDSIVVFGFCHENKPHNAAMADMRSLAARILKRNHIPDHECHASPQKPAKAL
jgi:hypothetical protein